MEIQYHGLLRRQLKRHLGEGRDKLVEWEGFIRAVNDAYHQYDSELNRLERSMELSSQELIQAVVKRREIKEQILRQNKALATLQKSTVCLLNTLDSQKIITIVLESAITMAGAQGGFVLQPDHNKERLYIKEGSGIYPEYKDRDLLGDEKLLYQAFITGETLVVNDYNGGYRYLPVIEPGATTTLIVVPLIARQEVMALTCLLYVQPLYHNAQEIVEVIQQFAAAAAIALENARLYTIAQMELTERRRVEDELRFVSSHDSLTGLFNRNYFEGEMARLKGNTKDIVGLIVCDLDGLKIINDTLGHAVGDEMLLASANIMNKVFCEIGKVARIGGDEFTVLVPGANNEMLARLCGSVQDFVKEYNELQYPVYLSISTGYASNENNQQDVTELFKEADKHMYREKMQRAQSARSAIVEKMMKSLEAGVGIAEGRAHRIDSIEELAAILPIKPIS